MEDNTKRKLHKVPQKRKNLRQIQNILRLCSNLTLMQRNQCILDKFQQKAIAFKLIRLYCMRLGTKLRGWNVDG